MSWYKIKSMWHISMSYGIIWHADMSHDSQRDKIHSLKAYYSLYSLVISNEINEEKTI